MRSYAPRRAGGGRREPKQGRSPGSGQENGVEAREVARFIADMTGQMEKMAGAAGLDLLSYFLAMARAESEAVSRGCGAGPTER
jgi:hypothetical protein